MKRLKQVSGARSIQKVRLLKIFEVESEPMTQTQPIKSPHRLTGATTATHVYTRGGVRGGGIINALFSWNNV